jgi:hypothetical protein
MEKLMKKLCLILVIILCVGFGTNAVCDDAVQENWREAFFEEIYDPEKGLEVAVTNAILAEAPPCDVMTEVISRGFNPHVVLVITVTNLKGRGLDLDDICACATGLGVPAKIVAQSFFDAGIEVDEVSQCQCLINAGYVSNPVIPEFPDSDSDNIPDNIEYIFCTDTNNADTDNDGIIDGVEDVNQNGIIDPGETNPCNPDSDGDGIQDGTELGYTIVGPDTDTNVFQDDLDPSTTTNPLLSDSDADGYTDGEEDKNHNGRIDVGESNPTFINGDINGDLEIDLSDPLITLQIMAGISPSSVPYNNAGVNGDNKIDLIETIWVLKKVARL